MIITRKKPLEELLNALEGFNKLFLVGCGECSTVCQTGGETELEDMKQVLEENGKTVVGAYVARSACHILEVKRDLRQFKDKAKEADAFIGMSCGAGVQTLAEILKKPVFTSNDTMFLGNIKRFGQFSEFCSLCGNCILNETGGICPVTRCPKGLLNGPCGGMNKGKCEVDSDNDCVWVAIYNRMKETGRLDKLKESQAPKDYSTARGPRTHKIDPRKI